MSSGSDVIAGPEVDMAELDANSSVPLSVDLSLNLGPSFALELALGGQDSEESVPISRPNWNWPRFEPGILAGGQEDDVALTVEDDSPEDHHEADGIVAALSQFNAGDSSHDIGRDLGWNGHEPDTDVGRSLNGLLLQSFRTARYTNHPQQPRQVLFPPVQDLVQTQDSSERGPTLETRVLAASDRSVSLLLPGANENDGLSSNGAFDVAASSNSSNENGKTEAGAVVGAGFECNVCLEMATEPVVTCCGHLFCWPCLYKWLHLHSSQKKCPVCKGFVPDEAITPIYGRGTGQAAETLSGSIPPRPHAHRVNGKRRRLDRLFAERPAAGALAAEVVLNRLRVAQRLQREYLDDGFRMRLHQRVMGRRAMGRREGFLRPHAMAALRTNAEASYVSHMLSPDQLHAEDVLTRMSSDHLDTADSLVAIGATMDGLREGLERMQRTLDVVSARPSQTAVFSPIRIADAGSSSVVCPLLNETRVGGLSEAGTPRHSANTLSHTEISEPPQAPSQRAASDAAGSFDLEPDSSHSRKRRRLN